MAYMHREGVVHGDLRSPNILVDQVACIRACAPIVAAAVTWSFVAAAVRVVLSHHACCEAQEPRLPRHNRISQGVPTMVRCQGLVLRAMHGNVYIHPACLAARAVATAGPGVLSMLSGNTLL